MKNHPLSQPKRPGLLVSRLSDLQGFLDLRSQWSALLQHNPLQSAFLSWEWNFAWWQAYSEGKKLWLITISCGEELVGIAPLVLIKKRRAGIGTRILTNLGDENLDIGGFIIPQNNASVYYALVDYLLQQHHLWDVLDLNEFLQADPGTSLLKKLFKKRGFSIFQQERLHYFLPLQGSWEEYLASLSQNLRGDLRRKMRRAKNLGQLRYVHHQGSEVSKEDLNIVYQINACGRHAYLFQSPEEKKFQENLRDLMQTTGWMDIHLLWVDDKPVAYRTGFHFQKRIEDWRNAFDVNFFELSVGKILLSFLIENAFNQGVMEVDFLRGDEDYKTRWKTSERTYLHLRIVHPRKFFYWLLYFFLPKIKHWIK